MCLSKFSNDQLLREYALVIAFNHYSVNETYPSEFDEGDIEQEILSRMTPDEDDEEIKRINKYRD